MLKIKTTKSIPAKANHFCYLIDGQKTLNQYDSLKLFRSYLSKKIEDKKSQIIRLINEDDHIIAIIIQRDVKKSSASFYESLRKLGNEVGHKLNSEKAVDAYITSTENTLSADEYLCFLEGMALGNYQFLKYKTEKKKNTLSTIHLFGNAPKSAELTEMLHVCESNLLARDLVNEPVITLNTLQLAKEIGKIGKKAGFSVKILNKAEIVKLKMGGLLGVNLGSVDPPIFAILEWNPANAKNKKPYVLVGKGVVYDTGGYSIKTGPHMPTMKCDMSGAAAVIGTLNALSTNKTPLHVIGLIPATDNRINGKALVPDDVIKMHDGSTVEVLNTDAEGRLILADALAYAKQYKPKLVIDLATLTGSAAAITGTYGTALMGTADENEKKQLREYGDQTYERVAELPYWEEYGDLLKSSVADLKNIGGPVGGAITAAKFLEHFTDYDWMHLDIAGPAFIEKQESYKSQGGTGVGVRLLYHFLKSKTKK
jgi:leucyl aminopeptidase